MDRCLLALSVLPAALLQVLPTNAHACTGAVYWRLQGWTSTADCLALVDQQDERAELANDCGDGTLLGPYDVEGTQFSAGTTATVTIPDGDGAWTWTLTTDADVVEITLDVTVEEYDDACSSFEDEPLDPQPEGCSHAGRTSRADGWLFAMLSLLVANRRTPRQRGRPQ